MKIRRIAQLLDATVVTGENLLDVEVYRACGSDMMSDVLAFAKDHAVLLTGLINEQVIRTAMMLDIQCVIFVRNKALKPEVIQLAESNHIVLLRTAQRMFEACGILYSHNLESGDSGRE